jgi:hypothetical protein
MHITQVPRYISTLYRKMQALFSKKSKYFLQKSLSYINIKELMKNDKK